MRKEAAPVSAAG